VTPDHNSIADVGPHADLLFSILST
jgi:hypothetical protein